MKKINVKQLVGISVLTAMVVVLQVLSMWIKVGPFPVTFALIPLILGAIFYGPKIGFILGLAMGIVILCDPSTQSFWVVNPFATIIICLLKTSVAGLLSGLAFKKLYKKNFTLAIILASVIAPIVNTSLFALGSMAFFWNTLTEWAGGENTLNYLFVTMIGVNFLVEFSLNAVLSPVFGYIVKTIDSRTNLGFNIDLKNKEKIEA